MHDKRYPKEEITFWCIARKPGEELTCKPPVPCKKSACERYREEYPYCLMMERVGRHGRIP